MIIHDVDQNSREWDLLRCGIPTASGFSKIITDTGRPSKQWEGWAAELAGELYAGEPVDPWSGNASTDRGHELEQEAADWYEFTRGGTVEKVGFITDDAVQWGCSPDRLIGDDGLLEIKCPKNKEHISSIVHIKQNGTCPPGYYQQAQGQLWITGRDYLDLVFYHPELPQECVRILPDQAVFDIYAEKLPEIIAKRDEILSVISDSA